MEELKPGYNCCFECGKGGDENTELIPTQLVGMICEDCLPEFSKKISAD